jgi:hypothetical protein
MGKRSQYPWAGWTTAFLQMLANKNAKPLGKEPFGRT